MMLECFQASFGNKVASCSNKLLRYLYRAAIQFKCKSQYKGPFCPDIHAKRSQDKGQTDDYYTSKNHRSEMNEPALTLLVVRHLITIHVFLVAEKQILWQ